MNDFEVDGGKNEDKNLKIDNEDGKPMTRTTCCIQEIDQNWPRLLLATKEAQNTSETECWISTPLRR